MPNRKFYLFCFDHLFVFNKINRKHYSCLSANFIRQTFIDYFVKENHCYIKSSPVRPFNDASLEFVNAGMNQFKNVFLGLEGIPVPKAVNSQKCIRVGGKHNDLNSVGKDTYHHTFFEMLGNWSFNDYFKVEACKLAWNLITTKPFSINPDRLYVTYFKGDDSLNLLPDLETKEIWKEIGVAKDRILPFGLKENFWEMGLRGPCGPCTEIHYDHLGTKSRPHLVNKDSPDLTELWNNVFIQFNRLEDGSLVPLEKHFVDTGMGLERLVAVLQGKFSNYDTDIFTPYFSAISKISGFSQYSGNFGNADEKGLDTGYRILADHSRMISIAIADNIFPDESHGLRRVIRKGLLVAEKFLPGNGVHLMVELSKIAGETFSQIFPEVSNNLRQVEYVLRDENELWEEIKLRSKMDWENLTKDNPHLESLSDVQSTGLISSFKELKQQKIPVHSVLPGDLCLVLYDRYGLNPQVMEELGRVLGYSVDMLQLEKDILILREKNKALIHSNQQFDLPRNTLEYIVNNFPLTDDSFKTVYYKNSNGYCFEKLRCKVQAIIKNGHCIDNISSILSPEIDVVVLLEKTNMWSLLKGGGDTGDIKLFDSENNKIGTIYVDRSFNLGGYVYHVGKAQISQEYACVPVETLIAEISIDHKNRLDLMRNTSAAHLLSLALRERFICNMQSYKTSNKTFSADFLVYGHLLNYDDIKSLEERINSLINAELNIEMTRKSTSDLVGSENLYFPPYASPNMKFFQLVNVHLNGDKSSKEVTIGPNVLNTKDIEHVCFINFEDKNRGRNLTVSGISGQNVITAMRDAKSMLSIVEEIDTDLKTKVSKLNSFMMESPIPLELKYDFLSKIQKLKSEIKKKLREEKIEYIKKAIVEAKAMSQGYLVLYVGKETKLERLLQLCLDFPIMLFACNGNYFSARCHVPKELSTLKAEDWMTNVANKLGGQCVVSKEQDSAIFLMRPIKIEKNELKSMVKKSEIIAKSEAESLLFKNKGKLLKKFKPKRS